MRHPSLATVAVISLILTFAAQGQPVVSEIRINPQGTVAEIAVSVYNYEVILDSTGTVRRVETVVDKSLVSSYTFQKETIKQKGGKNCEFSKGRLSYIHDVQFVYAHGTTDRVERIGDLKIAYLGKDNRISQVGCLELKYEASTNRLENVGLTRIFYDFERKKISETTIVDRNVCTARVRVLNPVEGYR